MAVVADRAELDVAPTLDEVRALAREHSLIPLRHTFIDDCETPVSAYLKLRGAGPSFLLESAEQGQRFGRRSPAARSACSATTSSAPSSRRSATRTPTSSACRTSR